MRDARGLSRMVLIGILVVLIVIAGAAFMFWPKGPSEPTATTTTTTTPEETTTETTEITPTMTTETTSSATSPTAMETETSATTTETTETTSTITLPEVGYVVPSDVRDLLKVAESMTYQWTSPEDVVQYSYELLGEESIEGVATWKVKIEFSNDETQEFTVWISQIDGVIKQVEIEGSIITGEMAENFHGTLALMMFPFAVFQGYIWAWHEYWNLPSDVGVVTHQSSQTQSFGPTTLTVQKFRLDPNPLYEPAEDLKYVEWGFAQLDSVGVVTHFKVESKKGEAVTFDLVSLTLAPGILS